MLKRKTENICSHEKWKKQLHTYKVYGRHQNHVFLYMRPHANNMNLKSFFFSYCLAYIKTTLQILYATTIITLYTYDDVCRVEQTMMMTQKL